MATMRRPGARAVTATLVIAALMSSYAAASSAATTPTSTAATPASAASDPDRLWGSDRYGTALAVSGEFDAGVPTVYVAAGSDFPDALSAAAAAAANGSPLLLTRRDDLPDGVADEIRRLAPARIVIVGGEGVVGGAVSAELAQLGATVRIGGRDRYETSRLLAQREFATGPQAFIATGRDFPDALVGAAAAAGVGAPLVLVDGARPLPDSVADFVTDTLGATRATLLGGYGAVPADVQGALQKSGLAVDRIGGLTRYDTAALVAEAFPAGPEATTAVLAAGTGFADALTAAALAGAMRAPLLLTGTSCAPAATAVLRAALAPQRAIVVGGTSVVSHDAAAGVPCTTADTTAIGEGWRTADVEVRGDAAVPYTDRPPVDVHTQTRALDASGLLVYLRVDTRAREDHPVAYAQYGISALLEYDATGDEAWLRLAVRQAEQLAAIRVLRGDAWWFPYKFPWSYDQRSLRPPWWSGMAQGEALSLFTRLAEHTGEARWRSAADATWRSFGQARIVGGPWSTLVRGDQLVFEEYAGDVEPLLVLNGHVFAMFGLYDYWRMTGDAEALRYFRGGAQTVLDWMPVIRQPGGISYYCADAAYCRRPFWQNATYHTIHSWQLDTLQRLTGDVRFGEWAQLLREDWTPPGARSARPAPLPDIEQLYPGSTVEP